MNHMRRLIRAQKGQGMTEYIIIVALIAIAAIAVITVFSKNLRSLFAASSNELAGQEQTSGTSAGARTDTAAGTKHMHNFGTATGTH
jgi:pilus assembly protein Flp/PilA